MKVYKTKWNDTIEEVEADRMTDKSVFINGNRNAIRSQCYNFFLTWAEAKDFLVNDAMTKMGQAKRKVDVARSRLERIKALRP